MTRTVGPVVSEREADALLRRNDPVAHAAFAFHRTHKNARLDFAHNPFLVQLYLDRHPKLVVTKSTQCGITEYLLCRATNEALVYGRSIFYVLPTLDLVSRFVQNRFDRSVLNTDVYQTEMAEARQTEGSLAKSVKLKHLGAGTVAFVGSNTPKVFSEFPADEIVIDELDFCDQDNVELAWERTSASELRHEVLVGNPTITAFGIDLRWAQSTQYEWHIKCDCGEWVTPDWFRHVVRENDSGRYELRDTEWEKGGHRDIFALCDACGSPLDLRDQGEWIGARPDADAHGYHVSKLFSGQVPLADLLQRFERGLVNDFIMQRFWNADLGLAYRAKGASLDNEDLRACVDTDWRMPARLEKGATVAGVDVGSSLHVRIDRAEGDGRWRAVFIGTVREFKDLAELHRRYRVKSGVIDALPETRLSRRVSQELPGWWMCYYGAAKAEEAKQKRERVVTVGRTESLDATAERIRTEQVILPANAASLPEYFAQMTASTRVYLEKDHRYDWQEGSRADHYFHAENYCRIAAGRLRSWRPA